MDWGRVGKRLMPTLTAITVLVMVLGATTCIGPAGPQGPERQPGCVVAASDSLESSKVMADYVCDGVDDEVEIQAAIDTLPASGGKVVLLEGIFHVSSSVNLRDNVHFDLLGEIRPSADVIMLYADGKSGFTIEGGTYNGQREELNTTEKGIHLLNCEQFRVKGVKVINTGAGGLVIYTSSRFAVSECRFEDTGPVDVGAGDGIKLYDSDYFTVSDCMSYQTGHCCFDAQYCSEFTFSHNTAMESLSRNGFTINGCWKGVLADNYSYENGGVLYGNGIVLENSYYMQIVGNYCLTNVDNGILVMTLDSAHPGDCYENLIVGNFIMDNNKGASGSDGVKLVRWDPAHDVLRNQIQNNCIIRGSEPRQEYGIRLTEGANNNIIEGNYVSAGGELGPILDDGTGNIIRSNTGYNPVGISSITVDVSPFTYTAGASPETVYISGGAVSAIAKDDHAIFGDSGRSVNLEPYESIVVTYTEAPIMWKDVR